MRIQKIWTTKYICVSVFVCKFPRFGFGFGTRWLRLFEAWNIFGITEATLRLSSSIYFVDCLSSHTWDVFGQTDPRFRSSFLFYPISLPHSSFGSFWTPCSPLPLQLDIRSSIVERSSCWAGGRRNRITLMLVSIPLVAMAYNL